MNDMNKKTILSIISFFVVLSANAQFLFRISGNGLNEPSYILGTIHNLPGSLLDSIPEYLEAESQCQQMYVEQKPSATTMVKSFLVWDYYQNNEDARTYHSLTKAEMLQARELLRQYMTDGSLEKDQFSNEDAYPLDHYIRQYESYVENGHLYVRVTLNTDIYTDKGCGYTVLKRDFYDVEDGGPAHARATIDLTTQKVVIFTTNGYA